jgi:hypothetical protein
MKQPNYIRYFRVFQNDTAITEISTNDFLPLKLKPNKKNWLIGETGKILCPIADVKYRLPAGGALFYGYNSREKAMEMAKAGALKHINLLIDEGKPGEKALYQYRFDHYEDLTVNLVEANIRKIQEEAVDVQLKKDKLNKQSS